MYLLAKCQSRGRVLASFCGKNDKNRGYDVEGTLYAKGYRNMSDSVITRRGEGVGGPPWALKLKFRVVKIISVFIQKLLLMQRRVSACDQRLEPWSMGLTGPNAFRIGRMCLLKLVSGLYCDFFLNSAIKCYDL